MGGKCSFIVQGGENVIMYYIRKYILKENEKEFQIDEYIFK